MPQFEFALGSADTLREAGVIVTDDFEEALRAIQKHAPISAGDSLVIGVAGFPPVHYECIQVEERASGRVPVWKPHARAA
jgi:hypothetical protein